MRLSSFAFPKTHLRTNESFLPGVHLKLFLAQSTTEWVECFLCETLFEIAMTTKTLSLDCKVRCARGTTLLNNLSQISIMHCRAQLQTVLGCLLIILMSQLIHILSLEQSLVGLFATHELVGTVLQVLWSCLNKVNIRFDLLFTKVLRSAHIPRVFNVPGENRWLDSTRGEVMNTFLWELTILHLLEEINQASHFITVRCLATYTYFYRHLRYLILYLPVWKQEQSFLKCSNTTRDY